MEEIIIPESYIYQTIEQKMYQVWLKPLGFEYNGKGFYFLNFQQGVYYLYVLVDSFQTAGCHIGFGAGIGIRYISEIFDNAISVSYANNTDNYRLNDICQGQGAYFYELQKGSFRYKVKTYEEVDQIALELAEVVKNKVIPFYRHFTDIREVDRLINQERGIQDKGNRPGISAYSDAAYDAIMGLIIAKLCRPAVFEQLAVEYRKMLDDEPFFTDKYDPAVEYLSKTDIGTYRDIQPPF